MGHPKYKSDFTSEELLEELFSRGHIGLDLRTLRTANETRQKEWDKEGGIDACYRATELAGEVGEALNVVKKLERERRGIRGSRDTVPHLGEELADVVICLDLLALEYGIDLSTVVRQKFNATSKKVGLRTMLPTPASEA
jgi:NTP pyrophosphatase (non-canonical NTP hydrolase)